MQPASPSRFKSLTILADVSTLKEAQSIRDLLEVEFTDLSIRLLPVPGLIPEMWEKILIPSLPTDQLVIGFGLCGTVAARIQETHPELGLSVMAINSPTTTAFWQVIWKSDQRVAIYSSNYEPIKGVNWTGLAETALDVDWLQHGMFSENGGNLCKYAIAYYVAAYLINRNLEPAVSSFSAQ